jgi:hypothetical protein
VIDREVNHVANCLTEVDKLVSGQQQLQDAEDKVAMLRQLDMLKQQLQQLKVTSYFLVFVSLSLFVFY